MPKLVLLLVTGGVGLRFICQRSTHQMIILKAMKSRYVLVAVPQFLNYLNLFDKNKGNRKQYYVEPTEFY